MTRPTWREITARLLLIGACVALAAGVKGIPRRDLTQHLPGSEVYAAEAYEEGRKIHEQAVELATRAAATQSDPAHARLTERAHKRFGDAIRRFDAALDFATRTEEALEFLPDLHARYGDAKVALGDLEGARLALGKALEIKPGELRAIYALARVQLAQRDHAAVRSSFERLELEAEVHAEAWEYLDKLIADMRHAVAEPDADTAFAAWVAEQATMVAETVRWSTLEE